MVPVIFVLADWGLTQLDFANRPAESVVSLAIAGLTGVILLMLLIGAFRRSRGREASCGQCGYLVRGISGLTCPECGADLREAGIIGGRSHRLGRRLVVVAWTLCVLMLWSCVAPIFDWHQPRPGWRKQIELELSSSSPAAFQRFSVRATGWGDAGDRLPRTTDRVWFEEFAGDASSMTIISYFYIPLKSVELRLRNNDGHWHKLTADYGVATMTRQESYAGPVKLPTQRLDLTLETLRSWLLQAGVAIDNDGAEHSIESLYGIIFDVQQFKQQKHDIYPWWPIHVARNETVQVKRWGQFALMQLPWLAVWLLGAWWLTRRAGREAGHETT